MKVLLPLTQYSPNIEKHLNAQELHWNQEPTCE